MQNIINEAPAKKNYDFIDAIRGIAMMSIVAEHTIGSYTFEPGSAKYWSYICFVQFAKFGTVAFFLLAGFLISEKFTDYTPAQYLKRRISTTFGPWLFWSLVFVLATVINIRIKARIYHNDDFNLANIMDHIKDVYLYTNYWFIINFLVSITLLLVFKRYLYSLYFGAVLLLFTIFYSVNIHYEWIEPSHTTAILGFVFFLWLGAQMRKHWHVIEQWITKLSYVTILFFLLITFGLGVMEISELTGKSLDPINTLRMSSILYSLVFFVLLLKINSFKFINNLKPRQTTYGIYLIHYIILSFLIPELFGHFNINFDNLSIAQFFLYKIVTFTIVYFLTLGLVLLLSRSRAKILVGN
jgi:hypothetical protein